MYGEILKKINCDEQFLWGLGVSPGEAECFDVYGLDEELLAMVPQPVLAVLFLYPLTEKVIYVPKIARVVLVPSESCFLFFIVSIKHKVFSSLNKKQGWTSISNSFFFVYKNIEISNDMIMKGSATNSLPLQAQTSA